MTKYYRMRRQALLLLENTKEGELITEPDQLASYFDDISFSDFISHVYNRRIANVLAKNKAIMKANIRKRWYLSPRGKSQETLYRLLASQDELSRLRGESQAIETTGSDPLLEAIKPQDIWNDFE